MDAPSPAAVAPVATVPLPLPTQSPAPDPLRRLWGPVTLRVAWELVRAGVQVRPPTLRAARDHALWRLPPGANIADAEAIATLAVEEYLARTEGRYAPWVPDPDLGILPDPRWRDAILDAADPVHDALFRLHYGDGLTMEEVEQRTELDMVLLRAAREAVRELTRAVLAEDGVALEEWDGARLDRLLRRVATAAGDLCPGPGGLATETGRSHAERCPRCARALRLLREGVLSPSDLFAPEDGRCLPVSEVDVACVLVHPDARRHVRTLHGVLGEALHPIAEDAFLVDMVAAPNLEADLKELAERGKPAVTHLRIVRRAIPGRWTRLALIGPGPDRLRTEAQALAWGEVVGIAPLPEPLPPPPSAARWWAGAAVMALLAAAAGVWALAPTSPRALVPLAAHRAGDGVVFDTEVHACVDVVELRDSGASLAFHSRTAGDKGSLTTGDGRYRVTTDAPIVLVVASPAPLDGIEQELRGLPTGAASADAAADALRQHHAGAAVMIVR